MGRDAPVQCGGGLERDQRPAASDARDETEVDLGGLVPSHVRDDINVGCTQPFDREKLTRSIKIAVRKRPVENDRIERIVNGIQRRLESLGESEIPSKVIGEMVMEVLADLDQVAFVRFASVYRNFREAKDFEDFVERLSGDDS